MHALYIFIIIFLILMKKVQRTKFMRASIHDAGDVDIVIITETKAWASNLMNGKDEVSKILV